MQAALSMFPEPPTIELPAPARGLRFARRQPVQLLAVIARIAETLAVVRDDSVDELLIYCQPQLARGAKAIELLGKSVMVGCRPFLRPSHLVITCRPEQNYHWRLQYVNQSSGRVLDPATYLMLSMNNPADLPLPVVQLSVLQQLADARQPCHLPLYELDFFNLLQSSRSYARTLQFALRHRLRRFLQTARD
ncbi:hypothetical protein [Halioxenophilus sp. WMMB6]|uniref:hypothetical protein n=1 Tax=Halioxenophilus sp. WMMB6 TaxID=3073815 RepID=UPI00295F4F16|nr:hypothetical protein [Halioxenophilus sp. WMMB6]